MAYIEMTQQVNTSTKIMIFLEGTILKPTSIFHLYNHKAYIPIEDSVNLIHNWQKQGAEIIYCTSCKKERHAKDMVQLLNRFGFVGTKLYYRTNKQTYKDIVETVSPNILIEDDCKTIGGAWQMCITYVSPKLKEQIQSIVVSEFKGINCLPASLESLKLY